MTATFKNTTELNTGDVLRHAGMIIKLGERKVYKHTHPDQELGLVEVIAFKGEILNVEEVNVDGVVPFSWRCIENKLGNEWTIQGNHLANWKVIETVAA